MINSQSNVLERNRPRHRQQQLRPSEKFQSFTVKVVHSRLLRDPAADYSFLLLPLASNSTCACRLASRGRPLYASSRTMHPVVWKLRSSWTAFGRLRALCDGSMVRAFSFRQSADYFVANVVRVWKRRWSKASTFEQLEPWPVAACAASFCLIAVSMQGLVIALRRHTVPDPYAALSAFLHYHT